MRTSLRAAEDHYGTISSTGSNNPVPYLAFDNEASYRRGPVILNTAESKVAQLSWHVYYLAQLLFLWRGLRSVCAGMSGRTSEVNGGEAMTSVNPKIKEVLDAVERVTLLVEDNARDMDKLGRSIDETLIRVKKTNEETRRILGGGIDRKAAGSGLSHTKV